MHLSQFLATQILVDFCLAALFLFAYTFYVGNFLKTGDKQWQYLKTEYQKRIDENGDLTNPPIFQPDEMATFFESIEFSLFDIFKTGFKYALISIIIIMAAFFSWYLPPNTFWGFFIATLFGTTTMISSTYLTFRLTIGTISRIPIQDSQFKFIQEVGSSLSLIIMLFIFASLVLLSVIFQVLFLKEKTPENFQLVGIAYMGFPFGVIFTSFFYRQSLTNASKGILIAANLVIRNFRFIAEIQNEISYTTKISQVTASLIIYTISNFMDFVIVLSLYVTMPFLSLSYSVEIQESSQHWGLLLGIIAIFSFVQACSKLASLKTVHTQEEDLEKSIQQQRLLTMILAIVVLIIGALFAFPDETFTIGNDNLAEFHKDNLTKWKMILCCSLGVICQILLLLLFSQFNAENPEERFQINKRAKNLPLTNLMFAYSQAFKKQIAIFLIFAIFLFCSQSIGGLAGLMAFLTGFFILIIMDVTFIFIAGCSQECQKCQLFTNFSKHVDDYMIQIAWLCQSYMGNSQLTNSCGLFVMGLIICSSVTLNSNLPISLMSNKFALIGLLLGGMLCYLNRAINQFNIYKVTEIALQEERIMQSLRGTEEEENAMKNWGQDYYLQKYQFCLRRVYLNLAIVISLSQICKTTLVVLANGLLFGIQSAVSLGIATLLFSFQQMIISIIAGGNLLNDQFYYQNDPQIDRNTQLFAAFLYGNIQGLTLEESGNTPFLIQTVYILILTLCGYDLFNKTGWLAF